MGVTSKKVSFMGSLDAMLSGRIDMPEGKPKAFAIYAHCFTCSKDFFAAKRISTGLAKHGIAVLRFDFTGLGQSEGEFSETTFSSNIADIIKAAKFLKEEYEAPQILIGHSLGGAAALYAADDIPNIKAVATLNSPYDPEHVTHHFKDELEIIKEKGKSKVRIGPGEYCLRHQFIEDLKKHKKKGFLNKKKPALFVFHSPQDKTVNIENARKIFSDAMHPKSFISLKGVDHLITKEEDAKYIADVLAISVMKYL